MSDVDTRVESAARVMLWETSMGCVDFEGEAAEQAMDIVRKILAAADAVEAQDRNEYDDEAIDSFHAGVEVGKDMGEAERDQLREALEEVRSGDYGSFAHGARQIAAAALAGSVSDKDREPACEICGGEADMFTQSVWVCDECDDRADALSARSVSDNPEDQACG